MAGPAASCYRVDQLRRTFQPRRFGSGYDPMQVDRLFEGLLAAMTGRGPMPVNENELDTLQFGLVPGGYFEAEVDAALREVQDILCAAADRRRRDEGPLAERGRALRAVRRPGRCVRRSAGRCGAARRRR